jgi:radical SAM protein with 4Fe4S-binding SPASM domain
MKEEAYGPYSDDLHSRLASRKDQRVPIDGMIELTRLCSVKCTHCYIGDARWKKDPEEMTTTEVMELLDTLFDRGTLWLCFTGGEAMIRRDFREIWVYAKKKGFILTLFSNATLIDESMADFLSTYPPFNLEISIYGASETIYETVTQVKGSWRRFLRGIENVQKSGVSWKLKTVLIRENAHELDQMKALASEWGVPFKFDGNINPSIGYGKSGGKAPCASRVEEDELIAAETSDASVLRQTRELLERTIPVGRGEKLYSCGAGQHGFYISAQGNLQMCILTGHRGASLRGAEGISEKFDRGWKGFESIREIKRLPDSPCQSCDIATLCESCPGFAHLETGNEQGAVEYLCRSAHLKALKLGVAHRCHPSHFVYDRVRGRSSMPEDKRKP